MLLHLASCYLGLYTVHVQTSPLVIINCANSVEQLRHGKKRRASTE